MAISADWANATGAGNVSTVTVPSGVAVGDLLIVGVHLDTPNANYKLPARPGPGTSGFFPIGSFTSGSGQDSAYYGKWVDDTDVAGAGSKTYTFTVTGDSVLWCVAVSGARIGYPVAFKQYKYADPIASSLAMTQIAPVVADGLAITVGIADDSSTLSIGSSSPTFTNRLDLTDSNLRVYVSDCSYGSAATLDFTLAASGSDYHHVHALIIAPAFDDYADADGYEFRLFTGCLIGDPAVSSDCNVEEPVWTIPGELLPASQEIVLFGHCTAVCSSYFYGQSAQWKYGGSDFEADDFFVNSNYPLPHPLLAKLTTGESPSDLTLDVWSGNSTREREVYNPQLLVIPYEALNDDSLAAWNEDDDSSSPVQLTTSAASFASVTLPAGGTWLVICVAIMGSPGGGNDTFVLDLHDGASVIVDRQGDMAYDNIIQGYTLATTQAGGTTVTLRGTCQVGSDSAYHYRSAMVAIKISELDDDISAATSATYTTADDEIIDEDDTATGDGDRLILLHATAAANETAGNTAGLKATWILDDSTTLNGGNSDVPWGETWGQLEQCAPEGTAGSGNPGRSEIFAMMLIPAAASGTRNIKANVDATLNSGDVENLQLVGFTPATVTGGPPAQDVELGYIDGTVS